MGLVGSSGACTQVAGGCSGILSVVEISQVVEMEGRTRTRNIQGYPCHFSLQNPDTPCVEYMPALTP